MLSRKLKNGVFVLEGLNSFATAYYFYYFYFYMHQVYGFGNKTNLLLAALNGGTYALSSWSAGKFSQRFGYFSGLKLGFIIMMTSLAVGGFLTSAVGHTLVMLCAVVGMAFTWPTLEALTAEGETNESMSHMVGVYNLVWAALAAVGYFVGGAVLDWLGLRSLFYVPIIIQFVQLTLTYWIQSRAGVLGAVMVSPVPETPELLPLPVSKAKSFLQMAWLSNPFAYIGINTLIAVVPGIASKFQLSTTMAGFFCSAWSFGRLGAFVVLWLWEGWHYRFRWLLTAFLTLIVSFAMILTITDLLVVVISELAFGAAIGLMYY